jgi:predicted RNA-binding Zn-ribbon protein involved in translation (DUF1610 family)
VQTGTEQPYLGLRIAFLPRNSTPRQDGNYSQRRQGYKIADHITAGGGTPVPFDEGIASGRDLGKRPDALRALDAIDAGEVQGLAWEDISRVTRDEHGTDAGIIAERLAGRRALLVTMERDYRLWRRPDLRDYKRETAAAGDELLTIRDRLWGGVLEKATTTPFFMGVPPYGYTTRLEEQPAGGRRGGTKAARVPARDEAAAPVMRALGYALDEATALGEVAYRLNLAGHFRQAVAGELAGVPVQWRTEDVRRVLDKPIYGGHWTLGRDSDGTSSIWEASPVCDDGHGGRIRALDVPHLAWFSPEQLAVWREKYAPALGTSGPRHRKAYYPLRNVLWCVSCGRVLVGFREGLYSCPQRGSKAMQRLCEAPQFITERGAVAAMMAEVPAAIASVRRHEAELAAAAADSDELDALRRRRDMRRRQCEALVAKWYPDDEELDVPDAIVAKLETWQRDIKELDGQIVAREQFLSRDPATRAVVAEVLRDPIGLLEQMPAAERLAHLRLIFGAVKIKAEGWGSGRTYKMVDYRNLLWEQSDNAGSAGAPSVYHTIALWLGRPA